MPPMLSPVSGLKVMHSLGAVLADLCNCTTVMHHAHLEPRALLPPCRRFCLACVSRSVLVKAKQVSPGIRASSSLQETIELAYKGHSYRLNDILVDKFCPSDLIEPGSAPLLLEQQRNDVHFSKGAEATLQQRPELRVRCTGITTCLRAGRASLCAEKIVPEALTIPIVSYNTFAMATCLVSL